MEKLAFLGPAGTFSEAAAMAYLELVAPSPLAKLPCATIRQAMHAVVTGEADRAIVPAENSVQGSVTTTLDGLWQWHMLKIQQALVLPIRHALITRATELSDITVVYSHTQGLAQCEQWLEEHLPHTAWLSTHSTTDSLREVANHPNCAAIASPRAAGLHNLPILYGQINDYVDNCTCFWVLSLAPLGEGQRTSLAFSVKDSPGMLVKPLIIFADRGINLSRIESRPSKRTLGEYVFFADLEAPASQPIVQSALDELQHITETLKIFGSYGVHYLKYG